MSKEACKILLKIDILFKDGKPDLDEVNTYNKYRKYCPKDGTGVMICKNDIEGIIAMWSHLFTELHRIPLEKQKHENADDQYIEYMLMWLGSMLFQRESYTSSTLIDFYNNYLKNTHLPFSFNYRIERKKNLLNANIEYMRRFYLLFNEICYITLTYSKNNINIHNIKRDSTRFHNKYTSLYGDINECDSYLNLLNNLETIYENFKKSLIKSNRNRSLRSILSVNFKKLPPTKKANKKSTIGFDCPKCKQVNSKAEKKKPKVAPKASQPAETISPPAAHPLPPQPQQVQSVSTPAPPSKPEPAKPKEPAPSQQVEQKPPLPPKQVLPSSTTTIQKESLGSQGVSDSTLNKLSNQEDTSKSSDSDQHNTANEIKEQGGGIVHKPEPSQDDKQQISSNKQENSEGGPKNPDKDLESQSVETGNLVDGALNPSSGSKTLGESGAPDGQVAEHSQWQSILRITSKGMDQLTNAFKFFETNKEKIINISNGIREVYHTSMANIQSAYDTSRSFLYDIIDHISSQSEIVDIPSTLDGDQSDPGKSGTDPPTFNGPSTLQKSPSQTSSETSQNFNEQTNTSQSTHDSSEKKNPDKNDQGGSQKTVTNPVIKQEDPGTEIRGNETRGIGDVYVLKKYKQIGISIIALLIPIILLIMYKYLPSGWRKELKRKKNMKKVMNTIGGKRPVQIIIKSGDTKKNGKHGYKPRSLGKKVTIKYIQTYAGRSCTIY
ncbi:PIR protein CIR protein [Plasmodium vinckei lentum]|uniref:PIR protein CIR protein n=1 Tax=Plasmodium vinckei lentum TaxID=138297 RepID=A0A6V7RWK2_PLAVN|nr:PIR protein CIR protein [Plasmodium vinckei lentum]